MQDVLAPPATLARPVAEKPADPNRAGKAWRELRDRAQKLGTGRMGWHEIRTGNPDDWLKEADPAKNQPAGFLRQEDSGKGVTKWEDNAETRDYLANAQKRAVELAEKGLGEISADLGIPAGQIAGKTLQEVYDAAKAKGWNVAEGDPKGDETRNYLRNAYEYAQELKAKSDEAGTAKSQVETETLDVALIAGFEIPEVAHQMLEVWASGGDVPKKIQELGVAKIITPTEGKQLSEPEMAQTALGYDLQIAGIQLEQQQIAEVYKKAQGKKKQLLETKYENLNKQVKQLVEKRSKLLVPNQVQEFVKACGVPEEAAVQNPLGALSKTIEQAIANKDARKSFIEQLRGQVGKENLKEKDVNSFEKFLNSQAIEKFVKDKALFGAKAAGGVGLLMVLMMWLASKKGQGQMG